MHILHRRELLRGMGLGISASLLGPMVSGLVREARGADPAKRFLLLRGHYSYPQQYLLPRVTSETDFALSKSMAALEPYKRDLVFLTNLYVPGIGTNGGHGVPLSDFLSGTKSLVGCTGGCTLGTSITFDRHLAKAIGAQDRVSSLNFSSSDHPENQRGSGSYDGADKAYPPVYSAVDAYKRTFMAGTGMSDVDPTALLKQEKSVLDFLVADLSRAQARLAAPERQKLERYAESLRAVEKKLAASVAPVTCNAGQAPTTTKPSMVNAEAMLDIAVTALACNVTHVGVVSLTHEDYNPLGAPPIGTAADHVHEINHKSHPFLETIQTWRVGQLARVVKKLRELGIGDSTLAMYADPNGTEHHGGFSTPQFLMMVGSLGGKLRTGWYRNYNRAKEPSRGVLEAPTGARAINDVWVAVGRAFGLPIDKFGDPAHNRGPLEGLLV